MLQIETRFNQKHKIRLSGKVPVTGASSCADRTVTTGNESWNGNVCDGLMDHYDGLLEDVYEVNDPRCADNLPYYEQSVRAWDTYAIWLYVATKGCNDHDREERYAHGK